MTDETNPRPPVQPHYFCDLDQAFNMQGLRYFTAVEGAAKEHAMELLDEALNKEKLLRGLLGIILSARPDNHEEVLASALAHVLTGISLYNSVSNHVIRVGDVDSPYDPLRTDNIAPHDDLWRANVRNEVRQFTIRMEKDKAEHQAKLAAVAEALEAEEQEKKRAEQKRKKAQAAARKLAKALAAERAATPSRRYTRRSR